jgi:hypothetical protein
MSVGSQERSYLKFDLSSIPSSATIISALMTVCATNSSGSPRDHELRLVTSAWTETALNWNSQPTVAASATLAIPVPATSGCVTMEVKNDVQAWVSGTTNFGWRIVDQDEPSAPPVNYSTREEPAAGSRPSLSVTFTN